MKTGVMGGTFDPIHCGHISVAEEACREIGLTEVIFMPAGQPYFKDLSAISPPEHRLKMIELAIAGKPSFRISRIELDRPGPSYAVDSIARIRQQLKPEDEIFFIMGWDSLLTLNRWYEADRLIRLCRIAVAPRPGLPRPDVSRLEKDLPGITERTVVMQGPLVDISSTEIRRRVSLGLPFDHLVPPAVAEYIREKGLYSK